MKYIDTDHLKAEIEKHIKEVKDAAERFRPNLGFFDAKLSGIYDVMAIIDALQQEQPCEDLKKYASRAGFDYVDDIESKYPGHIWNDHDVEFAYRDGIIAGAEWQKEQMLQLAKNRYENAMTFVSGNQDVDQAIQLDRLGLVTIIQKMESV